MYLIYNVVLILGEQQNDSDIYTYTYIVFRFFSIIGFYIKYSIGPLLCNRSLFTYFVYSIVYMLIPNS